MTNKKTFLSFFFQLILLIKNKKTPTITIGVKSRELQNLLFVYFNVAGFEFRCNFKYKN